MEEQIGRYPFEYKAITDPVVDIHKARQVIVGDARERVVALPLHIDDIARVGELFDISYALFLRNAVETQGFPMPLTLLDGSSPQDAPDLVILPDQYKARLSENYHLALADGEIGPKTATFIRDDLWAALPSAIISAITGPDAVPLAQIYLLQIPAFRKAVESVIQYQAAYLRGQVNFHS